MKNQLLPLQPARGSDRVGIAQNVNFDAKVSQFPHICVQTVKRMPAAVTENRKTSRSVRMGSIRRIIGTCHCRVGALSLSLLQLFDTCDPGSHFVQPSNRLRNRCLLRSGRVNAAAVQSSILRTLESMANTSSKILTARNPAGACFSWPWRL